MSKLEISKLKSLLQEAAYAQAVEGSFSFDAAIRAVRASNPDSIRAVSETLEDATMRRYLSQLGERKPPPVSDDQIEMFSDYPGARQWITVPGEDDPILTQDAKLRQLGIWLAEGHRSGSTRRQREPGMAKLLRDLSKVAKGNLELTVQEAMALLKKKSGEDD